MYKKKDRSGAGKLIAVLIILTVLGGAIFFLLKTYTIQTVYVEGNLHYTQEEIMEIVMKGPLGNNSLYLSFIYRNKGVENIPFVDVMDVSILSPDTIKITVYEKSLAGYVKYLDSYMYFDKDGYVVESSSVKTVGIPQITGLTFDHMILGEPLPVENPEVFGSIMTITRLLDKYALVSDKIFFHSNKEVTIYFGQVRVALGNDSKLLEEKVMLLPQMLEKLTDRKGTLHMETYTEDNSFINFEPDMEK